MQTRLHMPWMRLSTRRVPMVRRAQSWKEEVSPGPGPSGRSQFDRYKHCYFFFVVVVVTVAKNNWQTQIKRRNVCSGFWYQEINVHPGCGSRGVWQRLLTSWWTRRQFRWEAEVLPSDLPPAAWLSAPKVSTASIIWGLAFKHNPIGDFSHANHHRANLSP